MGRIFPSSQFKKPIILIFSFFAFYSSQRSSNPHSESLPCTSIGEKFRDHCEECGLRSPGNPYLDLPLVSCWHEDCSTKFHLTCAQFGGILIATSQYPFCFYITCRRHLSEYREVCCSLLSLSDQIYRFQRLFFIFQFEHDEEVPPLTPGDMVYALHSGNGRYYKATAMSPAGPRLCKLAFSDGTFSRDTPSDCILVRWCFSEFNLNQGCAEWNKIRLFLCALQDHDWEKLGMPRIGSKVKVRWTDGLVYSAVFQGASTDKWNVIRMNVIFLLKMEHFQGHFLVVGSFSKWPNPQSPTW